jgi:hypothetical protein
MKMKFSLMTAAFIIAAISVNAQKAYIRAGLNLANVSVNDNGRVDEANMLTTFHVGIVGDVAIAPMLSFQPGLLFTGKGSKIQRGEPSDIGYYKQSSNPYYIEVPMNIVFKGPIGTSSKFFAGAGPYIAVGIAGKNKTEGRTIIGTFENENDITFSDDDPTTLDDEEGAGFGILKRFDYGLNGTAGIEGKSTVIGVNYGLGLAKLQSGSNSGTDNNNKHRVLGFFIGFKF